MPEDPPGDQPHSQYADSDLPIYVLKFFSQKLPGKITLIEMRIDGDVLSQSLREDALFILRGGPEHDTEKLMIQACGVETWAQVREQILTDANFENAAAEMKRFVLQHFPKLLRKTYDVISLAAVVSLLEDLVFTKDVDRDAREELVKRVLKAAVKGLQDELKQILKTRSSGRPKVIEEAFPPIVGRVINIGRAIMGDATGEDAVPGLKQIAMAIDPDLTEDALGKRLKRVGHSWTNIKSHLAHPELQSDEKHE